MEVVKEPLAQWEFDILKQLAIEKPNNVGLTGGQFLEILSRLEQAEQAVARVREVCASDAYEVSNEFGDYDAVAVENILDALDGDGRG